MNSKMIGKLRLLEPSDILLSIRQTPSDAEKVVATKRLFKATSNHIVLKQLTPGYYLIKNMILTEGTSNPVVLKNVIAIFL